MSDVRVPMSILYDLLDRRLGQTPRALVEEANSLYWNLRFYYVLFFT